MTIWAEKDYQKSLLIAETEDSLKSGSRVNAPTIAAVLNSLRIKQFVFNNDFEINQREKSSYTSIGHSPDMWYFIATVNNPISCMDGGGILIDKKTTNQNVVRQYNPLFTSKDIGKEFTIVYDIETDKPFINIIGFGEQRIEMDISIGRNRYEHTFVLRANDIINNRVELLFLNVEGSITNTKIKLHNVDTFEGDIAYPHVKEDYLLELLRCQNYVKPIIIGFTSHVSSISTAIAFNVDLNMNSIPTLTLINEGALENTNTITYAVINKYSIRFAIAGNMVGMTRVYNRTYIASCEPL